MAPDFSEDSPKNSPLTSSRRKFLLGTGVGGALGVGGTLIATKVAHDAGHSPSGTQKADILPFYGEHQAGIATPMQEHLLIAAFNVRTEDASALKDMLNKWTELASRMVRGEETEPGGTNPDLYVTPQDTGEAAGLSAGHLTITIGYGPTLFDDRFGLKEKQPSRLKPLPHFPRDQIDESISYGDIIVQACADDPQVAVHAIRNLAFHGTGVVDVRWSQLGYGRASATSREQDTPRNLFGFKDGTNNIKGEDTDALNEHVWSPEGGWMSGGTYMCIRRIRMTIESWDAQVLNEQQLIFGRYKQSGAPLTMENEFDEIPFDLVIGREPAIAEDSHIALAHPDNNDGARMLRRAYNFTEGTDKRGHLSAGLFFIAYVTDPHTHFVPIQTKLSKLDLMNEYVRYESTGVYACPRGLKEGEKWGDQLFS